ncbi:MAG: HDOD domain-containing protein, partial [Vicinamibacterales bacterium]
LAVAGILDRMTAGIESFEPGVPYLVGLCHDLGEVVLRQCLAEEYDQLAQAGVDGAGLATHQVESAAFGVPYPELIDRIFTKLALPAAIAVPVKEHTEHGRGGGKGRPSSLLTKALLVADQYAHGLQLASSPRAAVAPVTIAEYRAAVPGARLPNLDGQGLRCEVLCSTAMMARLSPAQEKELARMIVPPATGTRVWYARHASLSPFDPLEAALRMLAAEVTLHDRLPTAGEASAYDALVIAAPKPGQSPFGLAEADRLTSAAPGKPLLYLSAMTTTQSTGSALRVGVYPIPLSDLGAFLASASKALSQAA